MERTVPVLLWKQMLANLVTAQLTEYGSNGEHGQGALRVVVEDFK